MPSVLQGEAVPNANGQKGTEVKLEEKLLSLVKPRALNSPARFLYITKAAGSTGDLPLNTEHKGPTSLKRRWAELPLGS